MSTATDLERLQRWMQDAITRPRDAAAAQDVADVVLPSAQLSSEQRLAIYTDMIALRFVEILQEDFPAVRALVGSDRFDRLARAYVREHPSTHYSLNVLGRRFARFLAARDAAELETRAFAAELAQLEDGIQACFDAPASQPLTPAELESVPPEAWDRAVLEKSPHARVLALRYPVNDWYQAFREDRAGPAPAPARSWLLLYRSDYRVWRSDVSAEQHAILAALFEGETLAEALAAGAAAGGVAIEALATSLGPWFQRWAGLGLFGAVRT